MPSDVGNATEAWAGTSRGARHIRRIRRTRRHPRPTQYGYLHADFPQQNTFDLWYDEAQFESYRRLGEASGTIAVGS